MPLALKQPESGERQGTLASLKMLAISRSFARRSKRSLNHGITSNSSHHHRRGDDSVSSTTTSSRANFPSDPQQLLNNIITETSAPFLHPLVKDSQTPRTPLFNRNDIRVGKLLQEGDFCQWRKAKVDIQHAARNNGSSSSTFTKAPGSMGLVAGSLQRSSLSTALPSECYNGQNKPSIGKNKQKDGYIIKYLHPKVMENYQRQLDNHQHYPHDQNNTSLDNTSSHHLNDTIFARSPEKNLEQAATRLVLEGLYLAHISHENISKLRGFSVGGLSALYASGRHDSLFLLLDRIEETLDKRMETWKVMQAERVHKRRKAASSHPAPLVPNVRSKKKDIDPTSPIYPEDLVCLKTNYALQILHALEYLHERRIVVRELQPESIGFLEYPNHHTVQICDLSSCKEMPRDKDYLPAELCTALHHTHSQELDHSSSMDDSQRSEPPYRVQMNSGKKCYLAPELFYQTDKQQRYTTQADIYSWSMIVTEMLTERKPYSNRQISDEWHWIESGKLRPALKQYPFPRSLQGVLESAWKRRDDKRPSAAALSNQVAIILNMLEGNGLPWTKSSKKTSNPHDDTAMHRSGVHSKQEEEQDDDVQSLAERAASYIHVSTNAASQSWSQVWNQAGDYSHHGPEQIDDREFQAELDASCDWVRQRRFKDFKEKVVFAHQKHAVQQGHH